VAELEKAPDVADVGVGHRVVRPFPVHPHAEPARLRGLDARVLRHAIAAGAGEAIEPIGLDLVLRVEPERLLHLDLDPQPLAVEAVLVALILAERRVIALEQILQRAAPGVVDAHRIVGRDRAIEERIGGSALVLPAQLRERSVAIPALEHAVARARCGRARPGQEQRRDRRTSDGLMVAARPSAVTAAGYHACPSRPLALDATKTSRARARRRGSRRAAPVGPCARGGRALHGADCYHRAAESAEPGHRRGPGCAAACSGRRGRRQRRTAVPAHGDELDDRLVDAGVECPARCAAALGYDVGRPGRHRLGPRCRGDAEGLRRRDGRFGRLRLLGQRRRLPLDILGRRRDVRHRAPGQLGRIGHERGARARDRRRSLDQPRLRRLRDADVRAGGVQWQSGQLADLPRVFGQRGLDLDAPPGLPRSRHRARRTTAVLPSPSCPTAA